MKKLLIFILFALLILFEPLFIKQASKLEEDVNINEIIQNNISDLNNTTNITEKIGEKKRVFISQKIPDEIYEKMLGKSIPMTEKENVDLDTLSYLKITYYGFDGSTNIGEMIVNAEIAEEVLEIFKELYEIKYPIEKIRLIDEYNADDELSMSDNNTSCFCYRVVSGTRTLSNHSKGTAIDINPLYNPYISNGKVSPASAELYADRGLKNSFQISRESEIYKIFINHGWSWGGDWKNKKDYQHFEKEI